MGFRKNREEVTLSIPPNMTRANPYAPFSNPPVAENVEESLKVLDSPETPDEEIFEVSVEIPHITHVTEEPVKTKEKPANKPKPKNALVNLEDKKQPTIKKAAKNVN